MCQNCRINPADFAQCPGYKLLRDPYAKPTADQLVPDEPLLDRQLAPGLEHGRALILLALPSQW